MINGKLERIKLDGETPYQFLIKQNDIQNFNLREGSVVSIAYFDSDPNSYRVVWVYPDTPDFPLKQTPKPSGYYKESYSQKQNAWSPEEIDLLANKRIVIVGAEFRISDFIPLAEDGSFILESLGGNENESRFEATVRNSDLIISAGEHSSHRGSRFAKEYAKKYTIPYRACPTSLSSVKRAILHGISEPDISFHSFF